ncbi:MAG: type II toxin-antitoxin system HicA family toxin [Spirochaetes bacterium]|nr:type II toxin-antitoxin system HicA family toxin [Spirochaetota bacterium]
MTGKELLKLMKKNGWKFSRIQGSHHIMEKGSKAISIPVHSNKDVKKGTLHNILKEAGLK